jgi:hypothetical protein
MLVSLGRQSQVTAARIQEVNSRLTNLGATPASNGAPSFYAHLAAGAQPQTLLDDLKTQLDLLAIRMRSGG